MTRQLIEKLAAEDLYQRRSKDPLIDLMLERLQLSFIGCSTIRIDTCQTGGDIAPNKLGVERAGKDVWVAKDVDITGCSIRDRGHVEEWHSLAGVDKAFCSIANLAVARLIDQDRRPELEIETGGHEEISVAQQKGQGGFGLGSHAWFSCTYTPVPEYPSGVERLAVVSCTEWSFGHVVERDCDITG